MTKHNAAEVYRQGDVWITRISPMEYRRQMSQTLGPANPDPDKGTILAEGEVTGHHHRIESKRVALRPSRNMNGIVRLLEVKKGEPVDLVHEEHETIKLSPGYYEVRIQREYAPAERSREQRVYD